MKKELDVSLFIDKYRYVWDMHTGILADKKNELLQDITALFIATKATSIMPIECPVCKGKGNVKVRNRDIVCSTCSGHKVINQIIIV